MIHTDPSASEGVRCVALLCALRVGIPGKNGMLTRNVISWALGQDPIAAGAAASCGPDEGGQDIATTIAIGMA